VTYYERPGLTIFQGDARRFCGLAGAALRGEGVVEG